MGVKRIFGYPGDGILGIMGALGRSPDLFDFVQVRHEEMAAFMAAGHAKFTGELGVCMATSGPGAIHLLNGLYDAKMDHQLVLAIVGQSARSAMGGNYQQEVDLMSLFKDVAGEYVQTCMDAVQMRQLVDRACRIALAERTVTCIIMPKDVQDLDAVEKPPHMHNIVHTSIGYSYPHTVSDWHDAQPGKIMHEIRFGELAHFHKVPFTPYYGTADATILYLIVLSEAYRWTGDVDLLKEYRTVAEGCLEWIDHSGDLDGDGFQEYKTFSSPGYDNMGWKDAGNAVVYADGSQVKQPKALVELQGYVYDAKTRMAEVFQVLGNEARAKALLQQAETLKRNFNKDFWMEDEGCFAYGLDPQKKQITSIASNAGQCLWGGIADQDKAERTAAGLLQEDMWSGWGIRTLSSKNPAYNPYEYQLGSIWPQDNGIIAAGLKRYGLAKEANQVIRGIFDAINRFDSYRPPEVFAGVSRKGEVDFPVLYPGGANIPQAWATGSIFHMMRSLFGLRADAPHKRLYVNPTLPDWLPEIEVQHLHVGPCSITLHFWREGETSRWEVREITTDTHVTKDDMIQVVSERVNE